MSNRASLEDRFWEKVQKSEGCWEWQATISREGYGRLSYNLKSEYAHRISYFLANGYWPTLFILHSCDNRRCVNPKHLMEGTHQDNMRDAAAKGRLDPYKFVDSSGEFRFKGELHGHSILTEDKVREIRQRWASGERGVAIARDYGVCPGAVYSVAHRRTWKHVE